MNAVEAPALGADLPIRLPIERQSIDFTFHAKCQLFHSLIHRSVGNISPPSKFTHGPFDCHPPQHPTSSLFISSNVVSLSA